MDIYIIYQSKDKTRYNQYINLFKDIKYNIHHIPVIIPKSDKDIILENITDPLNLYNIKNNILHITNNYLNNEKQIFNTYTHVQLWQKCLELNKPIIIIEDNEFDFHKLYTSINYINKHKLPKNTHLITLINDKYNSKPYNYYYNIILNLVGIQCYYITPNGSSILLKHAYPLSLHTDYYINMCIMTLYLNVYRPKQILTHTYNKNYYLSYESILKYILFVLMLCIILLIFFYIK